MAWRPVGRDGAPRSQRILAPLALLVLAACSGTGPSELGTVVALDSGSVQGAIDDDGILSFRGIPYAAAPVGALRFRPPESVEPWGGVRDAREFGPICPQPPPGTVDQAFFEQLVGRVGMGWVQQKLLSAAVRLAPKLEQSEDCLSLNVWTPALTGAHPVMVWMHGGGYLAGSGAQIPEAGAVYARRGIVTITINYRLGALGFLAHPALSAESPHASSGNYGTLDQIAALEWVRANVERFGGDPDHVTIFGESAGGFSMGHMMTSPLARGLFHGVIAQSGIGTHEFLDLDEQSDGLPSAEHAGIRLLETLGLAGAADPAAALRSLSLDELRSFIPHDSEIAQAMRPNVDGWVLPLSVARAFREERQARVPLLIGFNSDEGTLLLTLTGSPLPNRSNPTTVAEWEAFLRSEMGDEADEALRLYPATTDAEVIRQAETLLGDVLFGQPALFAARMHAKAGAATYVYRFSRASPGKGQTAGAYHAADLAKVFEFPFPLFPSDATDAELTAVMGDYWAAFAHTGRPEAETRPDWSAFDPAEPQWMELGDAVGMRPAEGGDRFALLERRRMAPLLAGTEAGR